MTTLFKSECDFYYTIIFIITSQFVTNKLFYYEQ